MSTTLQNCRAVPGWIKPFLQHIENGFSERNAAAKSGVGSPTILRRMETDPQFAADVTKAHKVQRPRYGHGAY